MDSDERKIDEALRLPNKGKVVAWFQGAAEFGPRALGNRSPLAAPWADYVKENLNDYVKHRGSFRPFALSIAEEDCARYLGFCRPEFREIVKEFLLPGDLVRLHVVHREANPLLWRLLKRFGEKAPAPLLVNTSFNALWRALGHYAA